MEQSLEARIGAPGIEDLLALNEEKVMITLPSSASNIASTSPVVA